MRIVSPLAAAVTIGVLSLGAAAPAAAAVGPRRYQSLATAQTQQLMSHLTTPFAQQSSPASCDRAATTGGVLLLPVLAGLAGNRTFRCVTRARAALVDLGGFVCTEDNDPDDVYTTAAGAVLRFSSGNLEAICQDVIRLVTPAPLTVDGCPAREDPVAVGTHEFTSRVRRSTGSYWDASVALGHPGALRSAFGGYKQLVRLGVGRHTVATDLSSITGAPTVLTFVIDVRR